MIKLIMKNNYFTFRLNLKSSFSLSDPLVLSGEEQQTLAWQYGSMAVQLYGSMAVWQYGSMAAWQYGSMAVWQYSCIEVLMCDFMIMCLY